MHAYRVMRKNYLKEKGVLRVKGKKCVKQKDDKITQIIM